MIIKDTFLRDIAKIVAWYPLRWLVMASPWRLVYFLGNTVGILDSIVSQNRNNQIVSNVLSTFGDKLTIKGARKITRRIIQRHYIEHFELHKFLSLDVNNLHDHIVFDGLDILDKELERGKGVIIVHMHFGSKQFPLIGLGLMGYPINQVGYRDSEAEDYSFIHRKVHLRIRTRIEDKFQAKHIHLGKFIRIAYRALSNNEILMIAGDGLGGIRGVGNNYIPIQLFGRTTMFPPGPARIARKTGSSIVPLFCIQQDNLKYKAIIGKPIKQQITDDIKLDVLTNTQAYARIFEKYIREYPDHWLFWEEFQKGHMIK